MNNPDINIFLLIFLVGTLPTVIWRFMGVYFGEKISDDSEVLHWVKAVAIALIAALVMRILIAPSGMLAETAFSSRIIAMVVAIIVCFATGKTLGPAMVAALITLYGLETLGIKLF